MDRTDGSQSGMGQEKQAAYLSRRVSEVGRGQATEGPVLCTRKLDFPLVADGSYRRVL